MIKYLCDFCGSEKVVVSVDVKSTDGDLLSHIKFCWGKVLLKRHVCVTCLNKWFDTLSKSMRNKLNYDNKQE